MFLLLTAMFHFIATITVFHHIMAIALPATIFLETEAIDVLQGMNLLTALNSSFLEYAG